MPYYEFSEGTSNKFWEITLKDKEVITHYGRIGADGQVTNKAFKSEAEAKSAYDKLIAEKTKKGYALKGAASATPAAAPAPKAAKAALPAKSDGGKFAAQLKRIDAYLIELDEKDFAAYKPGASDAELKTLSETVFGGKEIPADVDTFFRWHNGQTRPKSIPGGDNRTPMSVTEAISAWKFLANPDEDCEGERSATWLPLFENGAGDYLVYEFGPKKTGTLIGYWHADEDRDVEYRSLASWAETIEELVKPDATEAKTSGKKAKFSVDLSGAAWKKVSSPNEATVVQKPIGTAYQYRRRYFAKEILFWCVFVKVAPNMWYHAMGVEGVEKSFEEIVETANKKRPPADYQWKTNDRLMSLEQLAGSSVSSDLKEPFTVANKWPVDHMGLYEAQIRVTMP